MDVKYTRGMAGKLTLALLALLLGAAQCEDQEGDQLQPLSCEDHTIPVTLSEEDNDTYNVVGELCWRGEPEGKTLQLLISGAGYGPVYWDFPYEPETYSYVLSASKKGYATFNLSRIGIGESDHPDGSLLNVDVHAYVIHQVVQSLRYEMDISFGPIVVVGHSMGSVITIALATRFPEGLDGIVLTGFVHNRNPDGSSAMAASAYSAAADPRFAEAGWADTYWTSRPGTRADMFYVIDNSDPEAIANDEATKETLSVSEVTSMRPYFGTNTLAIQFPVLILVGDDDIIGCSEEFDCRDHEMVETHEQGFFSPEACIETNVIEQTGHNLNLHLNAPESYAVINDWMERRIGIQPESSPSAPCAP
ncbi:MAG: alpha/beta hydrolase [Proteobacteria bacterium]|nr:alpha/beta hydrolase [Pseudomonadota bacterium]